VWSGALENFKTLGERVWVRGHVIDAPSCPNPIDNSDAFLGVRQMEPLRSFERRDLLRHSVAGWYQRSEHPQRDDDENHDCAFHAQIVLLESFEGKRFDGWLLGVCRE
jgi:hypothetical protein